MRQSDIPRKMYVRHREGYPETDMFYSAMRGFQMLNVEITPYTWFDEVDTMEDLGPDVGVVGYIGDVLRALDKIGAQRPDPVDYPSELRSYLGRNVWQGTIDDVLRKVEPVFVKPIEHKLFSGFVYKPSGQQRLASLDESTPVWMSDVVDMRSEHRAFVLDGRLIDVCRYKGDWSLAPDRRVVESAVEKLGKPIVSYCLDFAVLGGGRTVLIEMNEGFSFGHLGLAQTTYATMLGRRWKEMTQPDTR